MDKYPYQTTMKMHDSGGLAGTNVYKDVAMCSPADVPTNSRIRDGVTYLEGQIAELHAVINMVESRLDTIMLPTPPQPASTSGPGAPSGSHLFDRLQGLHGALNAAQERLRAVLQRIEL